MHLHVCLILAHWLSLTIGIGIGCGDLALERFQLSKRRQDRSDLHEAFSCTSKKAGVPKTHAVACVVNISEKAKTQILVWLTT
jgi:hypothetical protein